LDLKRDVTS